MTESERMPLAPDAPARPDATQTLLTLAGPGLARLEARLRGMAAVDDPVLAPMLESVFAGPGKRMRPALVLLIGRMGAPDEDALDHMAAGVELLHTASLVHDDVVDESSTRRGAPTLFTRVGNALAVLVGDYLFSQAAQACVATRNLEVVGLFAETLGAMAQGQVNDANAQVSSSSWRSVSRERYYRTIWGKTGSLFVLACQGTGLLASLRPDQVAALRTYGEKLGLAFQVADDVLDFTASEAELGKPVGGDLRQGTVTLPVILLRDGELANGRFEATFGSDDVDAQVRLVQASGAAEAARAEAEALVREAQAALAVLPPGEERDALQALAEHALTRRA